MAESPSATRVSPLHVALVLVAVAHVAPIWAVRYFPTQDGPSHVENAVILRRLLTGNPPEAWQIYGIAPLPVPNWTSHVILAGLTGIMNPRLAEKVLISLYVVGLPLAVAYAGRSVRRGGEWVGFLALPFVYSLALHKGLYNFCFSLIVFFLLIGYAIRHYDPMRRRDIAGLMALSVLLYFSHVVSLLIAYAVLSGMALGVWMKQRRNVNPLPWRKLAWAALALTPGLLLVIWFFAFARHEATDQRPIGVQLLRFFELDALASFRKPELLVAIGFSALIWATVISLLVMKSVRRTWSRWDGLLLVALALVVVYVFAPNSAAGGGQISFRLSLYPYFVLLMWIAAQPVAKRQGALVACMAIAAAVVFMGVRWTSYRTLDNRMREFVSVANVIEPGTSVAAIDASRESALAHKISWRVRPFWHALGYVAAERELLNEVNYEVRMGYFPVITHGTWKMVSSTALDRVSDDERDALGAKYVVVWSLDPGKVGVSEPTAARLQEWYDVAYRSPRGMAVVWRAKR